MIDLLKIEDPAFLKNLSLSELYELATQIRHFLIENVAKTGGHLSSNLGVIELTIALHYVFESPKDRLIFDVGHQGYTHKILTGRAKEFPTLRKINGLSGFLKHQESIHDVWEAGHSSTALAALSGFEVVRKMNRETYKNVALVGDGSLNSGLSFEALNFLGQRQNLAPIIVLNDNEMSISKNVGTISKMLTSMRTTKPYLKATRQGNRIPQFLKNLKERFAKMIRGLANNMTIFDEFGFKYYGPIDGHNFKTLIKYLQIVKSLNKPCVLHVVTKKGKGYSFAENDIDGHWHGVKPFDIVTGIPVNGKAENEHSWSSIIAEYLCEHAKNNSDFRVIVPAMIAGSDLFKFQSKYPDQLIDVGICEAFAVCFAGAVALENKPVFVPIYSSFLQRAYDQVSHDVARQNLHVVFGIDRSGLVGEDGDTHQGIYDIAFLRHLPNMQILQGMTVSETYSLLDYAFCVGKGPIAIRYSNGYVKYDVSVLDNRETIMKPCWTQVTEGGTVNLIAYGDNAARMQSLIRTRCLPVNLYNARFIKPVDEIMLAQILSNGFKTIVLEDVTVSGGLGSSIFEVGQSLGMDTKNIRIIGLPDRFIEHGDVKDLYQKYGLDDEAIMSLINQTSLR